MANQAAASASYYRGLYGWFRNLRIRAKILVNNMVFILMLVVVAGAAIWGMSRMAGSANEAGERQKKIANVWAMHRYLLAKGLGESDYINSSDIRLVSQFKADSTIADILLQQLDSTGNTAAEAGLIKQLTADNKAFDALFLDQIIPAVQSKNDPAKIAELHGQSSQSIKKMAATSQQLIDAYTAEADAANSASESLQRQSQLLMLGILIITILLGIVLSVFTSNTIAGPVQIVTNAAAMLASGDLNHHLMVKTRDEIGIMVGAFIRTFDYLREVADAASRIARGDLTATIEPKSENDALGTACAQMLVNLRQLVGQISQGAESVAAASSQLHGAAEQSGTAAAQVATTIQQVASGINDQAEAIGTCAGSTQQLARAAEGIANGAQEQASAVQRTNELTGRMAELVRQAGKQAEAIAAAGEKMSAAAREGASSVSQSNEGMASIQQRTIMAAEKVKEMGTRAEEISRIVETIDEIADKTDMLALNAAVEAARAGEHGRGFAVVADQVRKLSEDSKLATRDIAGLIERVQRTVREAVEAIEASAEEVSGGMSLAEEAGQSLQNILNAAEDSASLTGRITHDLREVEEQAGSVAEAIQMVSAVVQENTASAEEMAATSTNINEAIDNVARISEQNSAAAEEVSAAAEEMSAQVEEMSASSQELSGLANELRAAISNFNLEINSAGEILPRQEALWESNEKHAAGSPGSEKSALTGAATVIQESKVRGGNGFHKGRN